jgi:osmotically-inducible protein OsmY
MPRLATTDEAIALNVTKVLRWETFAEARRIRATVVDGWVTLIGVVDWEFQKNNAEAGVAKLNGVLGVSNDIVVEQVSQT